MKYIYILLLGLLIESVAQAQLPRWTIPPRYDRISVKVDDRLLQTDSVFTSALWTMDGACLFKTEHQIHPFKDGVAIVTKRGSDKLIGTVDLSGKFITFPDLNVAYGHLFFEDGLLICLDSDGYAYYGKDGSKRNFPVSLRSYPFNGGYAPYFTYDQLEKRKDPYYGYYRADGKEMKYKMVEKGIEKEFDPKSISFLSGIGVNKKGVGVIKNKLYLFSSDTGLFEPFMYGEGDSDKKRHLTLTGDFEGDFQNLPKDSVEIKAKYGKNQMAILYFDKELRPLEFIFDEGQQSFQTADSQEHEYVSDIKPYREGLKNGLTVGDKQVLPPQFDEVGLRYGNKCFVKYNGKWGIVEILPGLDYTLKLNKGNDVPFRHQTFETQIRLDLPSEISARDARIDIPESSGCVIDKTSRETKDTESGNFVTYECSLSIPEDLPDTSTDITYSPVRVSYEGLSLFEQPIDIKAWHYKYYNVDPIESETSITNGIASFTININKESSAGEVDYPFEVKIDAGSVAVELEKISEMRYKCLVSNLQEGDNSLNILIIEKGCPPSIFPFEIYYTKPVPKKKTQESVVVRKKTPQAPKTPVRIEL